MLLKLHFTENALTLELLLQGTERAPLHRNLAHALPQIDKLPSARQVRWHCDIDPSDTY